MVSVTVHRPSVEGINILELKDGSFGDVVSGYARAEGSAKRENVSRTNISMVYYRMP